MRVIFNSVTYRKVLVIIGGLSVVKAEEIESLVIQTFTVHHCPRKTCRRLVYLVDDVCPHCGYNLRKWRRNWAKGFLEFMIRSGKSNNI